MIVMISMKPSKQRLALHNADLVTRRGMVAAHLSKELRAQYKRRSMAIRKGDEVKIIRGDNFGKSGEVTQVDSRKYMIFVNGVNLKRTIGTEKQVPVEPSNVVITSLALNDNARQRILLRKVKQVVVPKKETPAPAPAAAKKEEKPAEEHSHEGHEHAHGHAHDHSHDHAEHAHKHEASKTKSATAKSKVAAKGGK